MESNEEVWNDWLAQENEYAVGERKSMEAGCGKYLNFIKIVLKEKMGGGLSFPNIARNMKQTLIYSATIPPQKGGSKA